MAKLDQSGDWARRLAPSLEEIEALALEAYANLPGEFRALSGENPVRDRRFSRGWNRRGDGPRKPLRHSRSVRGPSDRRSLDARDRRDGDRILLYRRPILDYWAEHEESLGSLVAHVLIHEIGHHFGLSDDDMEALEAKAD